MKTQQPGHRWKRPAIALADRAQYCLDNAHWEVRDGSGDLVKAIREVKMLQGKEEGPMRKTRTTRGITLHAAPGYHFCIVTKCKTQMSDGSLSKCPAHQSAELAETLPANRVASGS